MYTEKQLEILSEAYDKEKDQNKQTVIDYFKPYFELKADEVRISRWFDIDYITVRFANTTDNGWSSFELEITLDKALRIQMPRLDTKNEWEAEQWKKAAKWYIEADMEEVKSLFGKITREAEKMFNRAMMENEAEERHAREEARAKKFEEARQSLKVGQIYKDGTSYFIITKICDKTVFGNFIEPNHRNYSYKSKKEELITKIANGRATLIDGDKTPEEIAYAEADKYLVVGQKFKNRFEDEITITKVESGAVHYNKKDILWDRIDSHWDYIERVKIWIAKGELKPIE